MKPQDRRNIVVTVAPVGFKLNAPGNPITPEDIAQTVVACADAGAAMVHLHVRDQQGEQTGDLEAFSQTLDRIRASSDIIIQGSTGGLSNLSLEERCVAVTEPRVEVASLNLGSVNFGEDVYVNRMPDIRFWAQQMADHQVVPELEIFEAGMLRAVQQLMTENVLQPPLSLNFCLGVRWALPADPKSIFFLQTLMDQALPWGVIHHGMTNLSLLATAIGLGASMVRVGFEDSRCGARGQDAQTNVELVKDVVALICQMGYDAASPHQARQILGLS